MNIIRKLTVRHLLNNQKRTIVTILGIAASTALITAILAGMFSFFKFFGTINRATEGNVHASFENLSWKQVEELKQDGRVLFAGALNYDPTISGVLVESDRDLRYRTGNIAHGDRDYYEQIVVSGYDGTLPVNSSEAAVEEAFLNDNGLNLGIGDTISFSEGNRYSIDPDGTRIYWGGNYHSEEQFEILSEETCTITAILHGNRPTTGYDILRGMEDGTPVSGEGSEKSYLQARITLKKPDSSSAKQLHALAEDHGITHYQMNTEFLISVFAVEGTGEGISSLFNLMAVGILIVCVTSITLIYNAFGMSLAEKIRYLGMLASVGATKQQKKASIYYEGLILGVIGIPLGILIGCLGASVTLDILGRKMLEADMIAGAKGMRGSVPLVLSPLVILVIVLLSALTIFLSAMIHARRASKASPIEALRETSTVKASARSLKTSPLIRKIFGYEGELAYKNIKRNGLKGTVIVISLAVSIIMFLSIDYFGGLIKKLNYYELDLPFQIFASCTYQEGERLKGEILELDGVKDIYPADFITVKYTKDEERPDFVPADQSILDPAFLSEDYKDLFSGLESIMVVPVDEEDFDELLRANQLKEEDFHGNELKGVLLDDYYHKETSRHVFNDGIIGQRVFYEDPENNPPAVEIAGLVSYEKDNYLFHLIPKATVAVFVPEAEYYAKAAEHINPSLLTITYGVVTDGEKREGVFNEINRILEEGSYTNYSTSDITGSLKIMDTVSLLLNTAMYGFTTLLTLIAAANIINTISTAILLRKKEFAMIRSVGMDRNGLRKMLVLETMLYGLRALAAGIPVSIALSYLMFTAMKDKLFAFELNWPMYGAVILAVFVIVGVSMALGGRKLTDESIIDTLKTDAV